MNRRELLRWGLMAGGSALLATFGARNRSARADEPGDNGGGEPMPLSPLILVPFSDPLPIPQPLAPVDPGTWAVPPDPAQHQLWMDPAAYYHIALMVAGHSFTSSPV